MMILDSIGELSGLKGPVVLAAGTFDGVHPGHQALIRRAMEEADSCGGTAVVMTFDRHPAALLRPQNAPKLLSSNREKIALLEAMKVPALLLLEFTPEFASIPARDFITSLVASARPLRAICVGSQWSFGRGGEGTVPLLKELGREHGFSVVQIQPVEYGGAPVSSTRIRRALSSGDFREASACLGRPFLLTGKIITGAGLGSKIGFPTANLEASGMQLPPDGVYAVRARRGGFIVNGVCNIGVRPTVDPADSERTVEVHLFDWSENLTGQELSLEFTAFLRPEKKFDGLEELKEQIARDCGRAREILSA